MPFPDTMQTLQQTVWQARIPLEIRLAASESRTFDRADPYLVSECDPPHDSNTWSDMADQIDLQLT